MQLDPADIAFGLAGPPVIGRFWYLTLGRRTSYYGTWASCAIGGIIGGTLPPATWGATWGSTASLILAAVLWWLSRRRKRKAPKLAGAKSRALLAAVVRTMRERSRPRPVFRPQPQGSG